jgi:hypothetical protein
VFETGIGAAEAKRSVGRWGGRLCNNAVTEIRCGVCDAVEKSGFVSGEDGRGWASLGFGFYFGHGEFELRDELCFRDTSSMI